GSRWSSPVRCRWGRPRPGGGGRPAGVPSGADERLVLGGGRGADEVVEGAERRGGAGAHGDDDLLVRHGGGVAGGEHARDRRLAPVVDDDLAAGAQLDR